MKYPTPGAYQEAVQFPASAFSDPVLKDAEPEATPLGLPEAMTGAFAVVFPMRSHGIRWAVKCFLTDIPDQRERYGAVARYLAEVDLPHTAEFDYQPRGIHIDGKPLPVLKMEWVDGISIARFIEEKLTEDSESGQAALRTLHVRWREMIGRLDAAGVAHGDLQHGNVLVDADANVRLVDYDTMFVPPLKGKQSPEVGHRNYQHPDRDESDFGPYLDRFSALVIDTAILACIHKPDLWERYSTGENLLFKSSDFFDPDASPLLGELRSAPAEVSRQADVLRHACRLEPEDAPSLDEIAKDQVDLQSSYAAPRRRRQSAEAVDRRDVFERRFAPAASVVAASAIILLALEYAAAAAALLALAALVGFVWTSWHYRRLPAVRRRHRLAKEEAYFSHLIMSLDQEVARLEDARSEFAGQMESEYDRRLNEVQETALRDRLKHHFVGEAGAFEGITHKAVVRLKLAGIRTAYQATPDRVNEIIQLSDESKASIRMWRASLAAEHEAAIPRELSPAEERRVKRRLEVRLEEMDHEIARLRHKIDVQKAERHQLRRRMGETRSTSLPHYLLFLARMRRVRSPEVAGDA